MVRFLLGTSVSSLALIREQRLSLLECGIVWRFFGPGTYYTKYGMEKFMLKISCFKFLILYFTGVNFQDHI